MQSNCGKVEFSLLFCLHGNEVEAIKFVIKLFHNINLLCQQLGDNNKVREDIFHKRMGALSFGHAPTHILLRLRCV